MTGASSGIGQAIVQRLSQEKIQDGNKYLVFGSARKPELVTPIEGVTFVALDVTRDTSVNDCIETIIQQAGRLDVLINNAGVTLHGAVEETEIDEAKWLFETNFFGVVRMIRKALPYMRSQQSGLMINVGSVAGFLPKPYEAMYSAAKHALAGFTESLFYEIAPFGIHTVLLEPGFIRTRLDQNAHTVTASISIYQKPREITLSNLQSDIAQGTKSEEVANLVKKIMEIHHPKFRYLIGSDAHRVSWLRKLLPNSLFAWGLKKRFLQKK